MNAFGYDAIHVYTDGSYCASRGLQAYGWVCANAVGSMAQARVVSSKGMKSFGPGSTHMEAAAMIDALWEFAPRNRKIIIHADNQALAHFVELYRAGEIDSSYFLAASKILREEDARKLLTLIDTVDFELVWVKGHKNNFYNLVADQMLRRASLDGKGDFSGLTWAHKALNSGRATIWGKCHTEARGYHNDYFTVEADEKNTAHTVAELKAA